MSEIVSSESELLILVDEYDQEIGCESKAVCHDGKGILHRAFSILIFNSQNELLLHQRSDQKRLWGGFWTNSCCSHPRQGETMEFATQRRLKEELAIACPLTFLYKFQYEASFGDAGSENELCYVYAGRCNQPPQFNENEIAELRWVSRDGLDSWLQSESQIFSPWFQMEWAEVKAGYWDVIENLEE